MSSDRGKSIMTVQTEFYQTKESEDVLIIVLHFSLFNKYMNFEDAFHVNNE